MQTPIASAHTFVMADGVELHRHDWPLPEGSAVRGTVVIVHGLGEHAGRYQHVARFLNDAGFAVAAYDQYGHGRSPGARGRLRRADCLRSDLTDVVDQIRAAMPERTPLIVLGHSMGGLVAADFTARAVREIDGLVLSSPALVTGMYGWQRLMARVLGRFAPGVAIGNGLKPQHISHDPGEVAAYRNDPLGHDRISGPLACFIDRNGSPAIAAAARWRVPTLLMFAGDDHLVDAEGSRCFAAAAPAAVVKAREFSGFYHEIFNETEREQVFAELGEWLDAHFHAAIDAD